MIVDVKSMVENKKEELKVKMIKLKESGKSVKLALVVASDDKASKIYVKKKRDMCLDIGLEEVEYMFDETVTQEELINKIGDLNKDDSINGILVQLPLYNHLDTLKVIEAIDPKKDVDGLHEVNAGKLFLGDLRAIVPCTPKGIMMVLDNLNVDFTGKNVVVIGRSNLVGKPIASLLLNRNATVTICHSKTKDLKSYTQNADIVVVAVGRAKLLTEDMIKQDTIVIDVGINRNDEGKIIGDCDTAALEHKAKYVTPVPGGIGLTTVISLIDNTINNVIDN